MDSEREPQAKIDLPIVTLVRKLRDSQAGCRRTCDFMVEARKNKEKADDYWNFVQTEIAAHFGGDITKEILLLDGCNIMKLHYREGSWNLSHVELTLIKLNP